MKSRYTLVLLVFALPFLAGFGGGGVNLLLIQTTDQQTLTDLRNYDIKPYIRGEEWGLAGSLSREVELLRRSRYRVNVLDADAWSKPD